ncbi:MAG: hypothetical protein AAFR59_10780 [Bacteroidota bacterium]
MRQLYVSTLFLCGFLFSTLWAQNVLLEEDFTGLASQGITGPAVANQIFTDPDNDWFIQVGPISGIANSADHARVEGPSISAYPSTTISEALQFQDVDEPVGFITRDIILSSVNTLDISIDVFEIGSLDSDDFVQIGYILDGSGTEIIVQTLSDDFSDSDGTGSSSTTDPGNINPVIQTVTVASLDVSANTRIQVFARADANSVSELIHIDNLRVTTPNSLPVEWVSFQAQAQTEEVNLRWVTAREVNNSHFEVERGINQARFETIGTLVGKGNTTGQQEYTFMDETPLTGTAWYRIKQVDVDGKFSYTQAIEVQLGAADMAFELVTLSDDRMFELSTTVRLEGSLIVRDIQGRTLQSMSLQPQGNVVLDLRPFPSGIYWVELRTVTGQKKVKSLSLR